MGDWTNLCQAIENGDKTKILDILREGIDVKAIDIHGDTVLHLAFGSLNISETQLIEILEIFLDRGADINSKNKLGKTILHLAVECQMRDLIVFCIRRNADINESDHNGNTIAHFAIEEEFKKFSLLFEKDVETNIELERESSSFVEWLAFKSIDFLHTRNKKNHSALYLANELNLQHIVVTLLGRVGDIGSVETDQTPLLFAYLRRDPNSSYVYPDNKTLTPIRSAFYESRRTYNIVKMILERTSFIDNITFSIALSSAIDRNLDFEVIDYLINKSTWHLDLTYSMKPLARTLVYKILEWKKQSKLKDDVYTSLRLVMLKIAFLDVENEDGMIFAHEFFIQQPSLERLELLKDGDANFSSFLHLASQYSDSVELIDFLVNEKCEVNVTKYSKYCSGTPLRVAIKYRNDNVALRLMELGADVNVEYENGKSLLGWVCSMGLVQMAEKLIEYGADFGRDGKDVVTLLHLSIDHPEVVELLVKSGLDVNVKDGMGRRPLHHAIIQNENLQSVVELLLKVGAHVDARDENNNTPLYYASRIYGRDKTVPELLLKYGADAGDSKILELVSESYYWRYEYLKRHFLKLNASKLLGMIPLDLSEDDKKFQNVCLAEVEMLKTFFIGDRTSLYDLLHKNRDRRCAYLHNEKLKNLVDDVEIEKKFPEYFVVIMGCYNEAKTRKSLVQSAKEAWLEITNFHLPDLCIDEILTYLSIEDLIRLIEAND